MEAKQKLGIFLALGILFFAVSIRESWTGMFNWYPISNAQQVTK